MMIPAPPAPSASWIGGIGRGLGYIVRLALETYQLGFAALKAVPAFVAVAAVPEFVQHVVEIRLGMFASRDAARAIANDATRWQFGYAKLTGLVLAMTLIGRYWAVGQSWRRALLVPLATLARALFAIVVLVAAAYLLSRDRVALPVAADIARTIASQIVQTGLFAWIAGIAFEDRKSTLRRAFADKFPAAMVMILLFVVAMVPGQFVHWLDHRFALGRSVPVIWGLMTFDALIVGLMAAIAGSGLYLGYYSGLTWRGWRPVPEEAGSSSDLTAP